MEGEKGLVQVHGARRNVINRNPEMLDSGSRIEAHIVWIKHRTRALIRSGQYAYLFSRLYT